MSKIPGFRSGKTWKKVVGVIGYLFIILIIICLISNKDSKPTTNTPTTSQTSTTTPENTPEQTTDEKTDPEKASLSSDDINKLKDYAKNLNGATFIKNIEADGNNVTISYVSNYSEYKSLNPNSKVSENSYLEYWRTGDAINKTLMDIPVRLMHQFPLLDKVKVILPFESKQYNVELDRATAEKYFNFSFKDLETQEAWTDKFINKYEYNKEERAKFSKKFIQI